MAAVGLFNVWSVVVVLLILKLGMLSNVQGGGQQRATTLQSLKTPPNNLAPPDSSYPTTLPLIATPKPHQVSKQLTRSSATGMGTDLFTSLVSVVIIFIVGFSTGFWWQLSRRKVQDLEPSQIPDQQQQQQVLKLHNSDAEFGSPRTPQIICNSPREQQLQQVGFLEKFTLEEIQSMTNFFRVVLGEGGQGTVYEASLPGPEPRQKAAVKRLDRNKALDWAALSSSSNNSKSDHEEEVVVKNPQDSTEKEFWSELHCISRLNHNNIVSLLGYCVQEDQLFLIYEFMEMGSLKHHLHGKKNGGQTAAAMGHHHHLLDWNQRMRVAVDVAQGLEYLHNHAKPTLVHRDIKPSNILFDAGMNAKIADFGLSKTQSLDPTTSLRIRGTPGYVDPVYFITGQATEKNDVYSYGVVLLELVTGKKATENNTSLVHWCRQFLQGGDPDVALAFHLPEMVDVRIHPTEYAPQQLLDVVQLAMHCVEDDLNQRPNMKEVGKRLYIANHHEDSLTGNGLLNHSYGSPGAPHAYSRAASSSNGWSTYEITETSIIIKYTVKNKKIAIRCKIWPTVKNLGKNTIEATLDDALIWKKSLWIYNACSTREFSVDEVKLRADWQLGLRFSRHLLKAGDPRRDQGPFCVEYLALKDEEGTPLIEYHGDRSPLVAPHHHTHVPKFGNWEANANTPAYTAVFDVAHAEKGGKMMNPNDPAENPALAATLGYSPPDDDQPPTPLGRREDPNATEEPSHQHYEQHSSQEEVDLCQQTEQPGRYSYEPPSRRPPGEVPPNRPHGDNARYAGRGGAAGGLARAVPSEPLHRRGVVDRDSNHNSDRSNGERSNTDRSSGRSAHRGGGHGGGPPVWDPRRRVPSGDDVSTPGTPSKSRLSAGIGRPEERPARGGALPKFGAWDAKDPNAGDGFTTIFQKALVEKKEGGPVHIPQFINELLPGSLEDPHQNQSSAQSKRSSQSRRSEVRDPFHEPLEAHGKVRSLREFITRWASGRGKELESCESTTRCASGHGKEIESCEGTTRWASGHGEELESSEGTTRWASGRGKELESSKAITRWVSGKERVDSTSFDTQWSTDLTLPGQKLEMHLEDKYNGTETFPVLDLLDFKPFVTQGGATCQELMSLEDNDLYHGTHGDTKGAAHEMNEPFKLEPNCGASSSRSLLSILQQSLKETAGRTTDLGNADTESEQTDIELEACVQQDGNGKQCKDEAAGRQAQKLLSSIHQRLQGLKRAIGVIPTPADYIVEDHCVQHDSESVITFGWRVASEANALELLFQSTKGMSSILGVGVEFAKVLVVPASLEVKIIGIGQASWDALWQDSSNNKDDVIDLVSIAGVRRPGAKLENPSNIEYLTAKQSATKCGVGLKNKSNTAHVNSTDVEPQSDCSCILDKVVEYLLLKKVIGAVMDKQCDGDEGQGSSSGVSSTKQGIGGMSSSQSILSLLMSYLSLNRWQKPTGGSDDDDDDETLPSKKQTHQVNHKRPTGNFCRVTVLPGPAGSFDPAGIPQELGTVSIDPTLVFEFNYKHDMNGVIWDKRIQITTTTSFDLGEAAPTELMSNSFGWYQNPLTVSLRNYGDAKLHSPNCQLNETLKETKISAKTTHTHSKNSTLQCAAQVQGGFRTFIQVTGSANKTTSNGETIAKEAASENLGSDVLKGFQYRDLREVRKSLLKYKFYRLPPPIRVLEDLEERYKYLGMGMCEAVVPTFIGTWLVTREDNNELSSYMFDAERTLNRIFKVGQISEQSEDFVQHYRVPMYVNHAMSHLCTLKDHHILKEHETLLKVLEVGIVGI